MKRIEVETAEDVRKAITQACKEKGTSMVRLAVATKTLPNTLTEFIAGRNKSMSIDKLFAILRNLGYKVQLVKEKV